MCVATTGTMQLLMEPSNLVEELQKPLLLILYKSRPLTERQPLVNLQLWTRQSWHELALAAMVVWQSVQLHYDTKTGMWVATYAPGCNSWCQKLGWAPGPLTTSG